MTPLQFLLFEASEGSDDSGLFEAMATVAPQQAPAVEAEIARVLAWAASAFPARGALEDGGDWEVDLQVLDDTGPGGRPLRQFSLSIVGSAAFRAAFAERFGDALA